AARVVILLAPALLLSNMYIFAPGISISKKNYYKIWISVSVAALNTILNFIMIPIFGITGAALATLISAFALFLAYMSLGQKFYFIPHNWRRLVWASLIACVLGTLGTFVSISPEADVAIKSLILLCSILAFIRIKVIEFIEIRQAAALLYNRLFLKRSEM
ncbi:MAG: polysaccharide biosynthesis protein, partial [Deltaproteobacteria bacterium]|nr:polysaccharide biosynthesis protein [Deltaproteobacteria bacterium]